MPTSVAGASSEEEEDEIGHLGEKLAKARIIESHALDQADLPEDAKRIAKKELKWGARKLGMPWVQGG